MVQVKKASKYGKYLFLLVAASVVSFVWPGKSGHSSILPSVPQAHADTPAGAAGVDGGDGGDGDCDGGGDCE